MNDVFKPHIRYHFTKSCRCAQCHSISESKYRLHLFANHLFPLLCLTQYDQLTDILSKISSK